MPDAGIHPHRGRCTNNTQSQGNRAVCLFGDPHVHNVTPSYSTRQECSHSSANTMGTIPPYGEDTPDRLPVQRKEKGGGTSAKSSVLRLTCVPLPHLVLPLSGWPAHAPRQRQHEVRQGDTHGSGFAAIRGVPLSNQQRKIGDDPVGVKAIRLGRRSGLP